MKNNWKQHAVDADFVEIEHATVEAAPEPNKEILCGVVLKRCPVISYNPWSKVLVYERDGELIQTNSLPYNGEGYVEVE